MSGWLFLVFAWLLDVPTALAQVPPGEAALDGARPGPDAGAAVSTPGPEPDEARVLYDGEVVARPLREPEPSARLELWARAAGRSEGWRLHVRTSPRSRWMEVCELPCQVHPPPGDWYLGVSLAGGGTPVGAEPAPLHLTRSGVLSLELVDRAARHVGGGFMIGFGLAGAITSAVFMGLASSTDPWGFRFLLGIPLTIGLALTGFGIGVAAAPRFVRITWAP